MRSLIPKHQPLRDILPGDSKIIEMVMTKTETHRKFEEIVGFAEVEKFIDTPVKRYSTGMYLRLAFAVAAHLEPEILIVDEVLAVGDAAFQKKCLGKMGDVAKQGRTVLFVSHNMAAISALCDRAVVLNNGQISFSGSSMDAIDNYFSLLQPTAGGQLDLVGKRDGDGRARLTHLYIKDREGRQVDHLPMGEDLRIEVKFSCNEPIRCPSFNIILLNHFGHRVIAARSHITVGQIQGCERGGSITCTISNPWLVAGQYVITISMYDKTVQLIDRIRNAAKLTIIRRDVYGTGKVPEADDSLLSPPVSWKLEYE